jgi:hypothetical protein
MPPQCVVLARDVLQRPGFADRPARAKVCNVGILGDLTQRYPLTAASQQDRHPRDLNGCRAKRHAVDSDVLALQCYCLACEQAGQHPQQLLDRRLS